ncbi:hypothetical protein HZS_4328 [Henneguya salminicola]|nr:hypothetical protein HZS_4328 [Henneguya salminicola]
MPVKLNSGPSHNKLFNRMTYYKNNAKIYYSLTMISKAAINERLIIFTDRTDEDGKIILKFIHFFFMRHNMDNRYDYCNSLSIGCVNIRIM